MTDEAAGTAFEDPADADAPAVDGPAPDTVLVEPFVSDDGDASLLALVDRLAAVLERSDLTELEVESGGTGLVLRKVVHSTAVAAPDAPVASSPEPAPSDAGAKPAAVRAPLTGIFYSSPGPGSPPYVTVGGEVAVGQVIGLIEAMKLFNEIKSDVAGRVVRVVAENGHLVKANQPLLEVEPL